MPERYANINNPTISAIVHALYRFGSAGEAADILRVLKENFIVAKKQIENPAHPSVILWIKGYEVTPQDKEKGVIGHFAVVTCKEAGGKFTLTATKMEADAREHPQRAQVRRGNPNWGHPVLRSARKGKSYATLEEAQAELALLHEQYPKVSIPNPDRLYIMIYCADRPPRERMVKHTLQIVARPDGRYAIDIKENPKKQLVATPAIAPAAEPPKGYFTAKLAIRRKPRAKKTPEDKA